MTGQKALKRIPCRSKISIVAENHSPWQSLEHSPPSCPWGNWTLYFENNHAFLLPRKSLSLEQALHPLPVSPISYKFCKISYSSSCFIAKQSKCIREVLVWPQLIAWTRLLNNTKLIMLMPIIFWRSWRVMTRWSHPSTVYRARKLGRKLLFRKSCRLNANRNCDKHWCNYKFQSTSKKNFESFQKHLTPMNFSFIKQRKIKMCFTRL